MQNNHLDMFTKSNFVISCQREGSEDFTADLLRFPIPSMSMPAVKISPPTVNHMKVVLNTAHVDFGAISADVILDENLDNFFYFYQWLLNVQRDKDWLDKTRVFMYLKSNKGNTIIKAELFDFTLTDISEISLDSTVDTAETEILPLTFDIGYVEYSRLIGGDWVKIV